MPPRKSVKTGAPRSPKVTKKSGKPASELPMVESGAIYFRTAPDKIARALEDAGCRVEEQSEEIFMVYPTIDAPLCHNGMAGVCVRIPWGGAQGREVVRRTDYHCQYCVSRTKPVEAVHALLKWGRLL